MWTWQKIYEQFEHDKQFMNNSNRINNLIVESAFRIIQANNLMEFFYRIKWFYEWKNLLLHHTSPNFCDSKKYVSQLQYAIKW